MTEDAQPTTDPTDPHYLPDADPAETWGWLHTLLSIPKVGDFLAFCLAIGPLVIVMFLLLPLGVDIESDSGMGWALLIALVPTYMWLRGMERVAGLRLLLPIPIINIPILWILPVLALCSVLLIFR